MEPIDILRIYIDFCNGSQITSSLASNCLLDWFGRSVRNKKRVEQYIKYTISQEQTQCFTNATCCPPIETKPQHMKTKEDPAENSILNKMPPQIRKRRFESYDQETSDNIDCMGEEYETPPQRRRKIDIPPKLTQGRTFLPISDDELDDSSDNSSKSTRFEGCKTTYKRNHSLDDSQIDYNPKRLKIDELHSDSFQITDGNQSLYTELRYLEAIGTIQAYQVGKYRGRTHSPTVEQNQQTKLQISYRLRHSDNEVQFALIIYNNLIQNLSVKRNLMNDFMDVSGESNDQNDKPVVTPRKIELVSPLRRLRF